MFLIEAVIMIAAVVLGVVFVAKNGIRWRRDASGGIASIEGVNVSAFGVAIFSAFSSAIRIDWQTSSISTISPRRTPRDCTL